MPQWMIVFVAMLAGGVLVAVLVAWRERVRALRRATTEAAPDRTLVASLGAMRADLDRVAGLVRDLERERATSYGRLEAQLEQAGRSTMALAETTQALTTALASPSTRGAWGERMAHDVLRAAGMVEGVNFQVQRTLASGSRPDITFPLPGGRCLHMDVKFPLDNYLLAMEADDPAAEERHRRAFLKDVRNRVREVTTRQYVDPEAGTLDYVLLFLPNEHVYGWVHQHDADLLDHAMAQRVILCSPLTLLAVLAVVREAVDNFGLQEASQEVLGLLGGFRAEWDRFTAVMDTLDKRLASARKAFDDLTGVRSRGIERHLRRIDDARADAGLGSADAADDRRERLRAVAGE